jgi:IPT/TIG domain
VVKVDAAGNKEWDKTYGGSSLDGLAALQQTREGGFILGGGSESEVSGDKSEASRGRTDYWVVKITDNVPAPQLVSFSPTAGLPGTMVTLTGKNLLTTYAVRFNGLKAKIEIVSDEVILATVPADATSGKITVETAGGKVNNSPVFTVKQPSLAAFVPFHGEVGSRVYLVGDRLTTAKAVYFNEVKAQKIKVFFDWAMYAVVPEGATTGMIQVVLAGGGKAITKSHFTVITPEVPLLSDPLLVRTATPGGTTAASTRAEPEVMAFPNPFHQQVSFSFTLTQPQPVTVKVYDLLGREVSALYQGEARAHQPYLMAWRPKAQQPAGLYIIRLQAPGQVIQKKVMLAR